MSLRCTNYLHTYPSPVSGVRMHILEGPLCAVLQGNKKDQLEICFESAMFRIIGGMGAQKDCDVVPKSPVQNN
ncbi:hypothetical protein ACS0TY_017807 [Phlomoides rotata]